METYRIEVGLKHGVKAGNIVGALANEAGLESRYIQRIDIREDHSLVELPEGMPKEVFRDLQKTRVMGQALRISRLKDAPPPRPTLSARNRDANAVATPSARSSTREHKPVGKRRIIRAEPAPGKTRPHRKRER